MLLLERVREWMKTGDKLGMQPPVEGRTESAEEIIARSQAEDEKKAAPVEEKAEAETEETTGPFQRLISSIGNIRKGTNKRKSASKNKKDNKDEDAVAAGE